MSRKRRYLPIGRFILPFISSLIIILLFFSACFQESPLALAEVPKFMQSRQPNGVFNIESMQALRKSEKWVDSVFNTLSEDEKIGQLFSIRAYSNKTETHYQEIEAIIKKYKVGGLTFFQGSPYQQARLTNRYQKLSPVPLMIAIDAEWGLGMRLDSTISFPHQMTLGAIQEDSIIYEMGVEIGKHCQRIGIHVNFAPVVDVNNNPYNPVIGDRSFGENKSNVARKGIAYMKGMQAQGIIANAKHFPGHGDTNKDSHLTLPVINHSRSRIDSLELYPFKSLINAGLMSTMVAHLKIPSLDSRPNLPTTLSDKVVNQLLVDELGFKGLVFTDALEMKGVANYFPPGEISLRALKAGNDVLLLPNDLGEAIRLIKAALQKNELSWDYVDKKVKKILSAKYFNGLHEYQPIPLNGIQQDLISRMASPR
ncbi:MAG: glycoside hydrolase family 3 N-terminal domain-containing protein, partial [Bacteroidota bacterium]